MAWEKSFSGKTVVVTGGGRGIGRTLCIELTKLGAKVYAIAKNADNLKSLQQEFPTIQTIAVDLGNWDATRAEIEKIETADMLVNNAAVIIPNNFFQVTQADFDTMCSVNMKAVINVSQVVAKKMIEAGKQGSIVNISSIAGLMAQPMSCVYSTLKAGLDHLTKIMALELGPSNIRVNSVNPGPVVTDMFANLEKDLKKNNQEPNFEAFYARTPTVKKMSDPEDVVNSILFLLSDLAPMVTGTILANDGGFCVS